MMSRLKTKAMAAPRIVKMMMISSSISDQLVTWNFTISSSWLGSAWSDLNQSEVGLALWHAAPVDCHAGVVVQVMQSHVLDDQTAVYLHSVAWGQKLASQWEIYFERKKFSKRIIEVFIQLVRIISVLAESIPARAELCRMMYFSSGRLERAGVERLARILPDLTHLTAGPGLPETEHSRLTLLPALPPTRPLPHWLTGLQANSVESSWAQVLSANRSGS